MEMRIRGTRVASRVRKIRSGNSSRVRDTNSCSLNFFDDSRILRLYIDRLDSEGVTIDDCTTVSRLVSDSLDAEGFSDQIRGRYNLEVSSPGLDRPLVKPVHFQRFVGEVVKAAAHVGVNGRKRFKENSYPPMKVAVRLRLTARFMNSHSITLQRRGSFLSFEAYAK